MHGYNPGGTTFPQSLSAATQACELRTWTLCSTSTDCTTTNSHRAHDSPYLGIQGACAHVLSRTQALECLRSGANNIISILVHSAVAQTVKSPVVDFTMGDKNRGCVLLSIPKYLTLLIRYDLFKLPNAWC